MLTCPYWNLGSGLNKWQLFCFLPKEVFVINILMMKANLWLAKLAFWKGLDLLVSCHLLYQLQQGQRPLLAWSLSMPQLFHPLAFRLMHLLWTWFLFLSCTRSICFWRWSPRVKIKVFDLPAEFQVSMGDARAMALITKLGWASAYRWRLPRHSDWAPSRDISLKLHSPIRWLFDPQPQLPSLDNGDSSFPTI